MSIYTENQKTVTLKLKRIDVCNILIALHASDQVTETTKWKNLHDAVLEQLKKHDKEQHEWMPLPKPYKIDDNEPNDDDDDRLELGFDPYLGCYTDDC